MNVLRCVFNSKFRQYTHKNLFIKAKRCIVTMINVSEYLLDRARPASEVLADLTPEDKERLNKIKIYHQYLIASGDIVPNNLTDENYLELLCLSTSQSIKYYKFLAKTEFKKENDVERLKQKALMREESLGRLKEPAEFPVNRFISKYHNKTVERLQIHRIFRSIVLQSQEIVFDLSFEDTMSRMETKNLARQIIFCYAFNKSLDEPFQMILSNADEKKILYNDLIKITTVGTETCAYKDLKLMPWLIDKRHYLDMYPGRRLVYLSPDSTNYFNQGEYDHNAIHIIGGIVDKGEHVPLTLARARKEKIEHRAFPIDRFIPWKSGDKSLTLNQAMRIISIARDTNGDWKSALEACIPSRALYDNHDREQKKLMNNSLRIK